MNIDERTENLDHRRGSGPEVPDRRKGDDQVVSDLRDHAEIV